MAKISNLSNKLKSFTGDISDTVNAVSETVMSTISEYRAIKGNDVPSTDTVCEIKTLSQLSDWIASVQSEASPAVSFIMQAQQQTLNSMETSILLGMVIDNILVYLHKAISVAANENEKNSIRESFAALLQSVIFVSEARLQHDIRRDKEEAVQMLENAGNMLQQSVKTAVETMMVMVPAGTAVKCAKAAHMPPTINNFINPKLLELGVISHLLSAKKKQEMMKERINDHYQMLRNLFKTLDRYSGMIGPSIQVHGMLSRYEDHLLEHLIDEQNEHIESCTTTFASQMRQYVDEMSISLHDEFQNKHPMRRTRRFAGFISAMKDTVKTQEVLGYDEVNYIYNFLKERYSSLLMQVSAIKNEIAEKEAQLKSLGLFQQAMKLMLVSQINDLEKKLSNMNITLTDIDEKTRVVEGIILPVRKRIEEYSQDLHRITEKYAIC